MNTLINTVQMNSPQYVQRPVYAIKNVPDLTNMPHEEMEENTSNVAAKRRSTIATTNVQEPQVNKEISKLEDDDLFEYNPPSTTTTTAKHTSDAIKRSSSQMYNTNMSKLTI